MVVILLIVAIIIAMLDDVLIDKRYAFTALAALVAVILIVDDWKDRFEHKRFGRR